MLARLRVGPTDSRLGTRPRLDVTVLAGGGVAHTSGGVGTLMLYLMDAWQGQPDAPSVRVLDTRGQGGLADGAWRFLVALLDVCWSAATGRVSLVHAHMTTRGSAVRKCLLCGIANLLGCPTIVHMHGADFIAFHAGLRPIYQRLITIVLRRARHVIVLGDGWQRFLTEQVGVPRARIAVVMNGVRGPQSAPPRRAGVGPARLLFLGRLGDRKGVPDLIAALASPRLAGLNWVATIAGDGDAARFATAVTAAGLDGRVSLPGWTDRSRTAQLLAEADILVLPSYHEALPIAVIEALAHRVAVITTPVGVIPEVLIDDVNAVLVAPGAVAPLADAIAALIEDPARRRRLADAGHRLFLARFDIAVVARQILRLYIAATTSPAARAGAAQLQPD
jgi:glycosyltransferase involved in cell wall biosynthesis